MEREDFYWEEEEIRPDIDETPYAEEPTMEDIVGCKACELGEI